MDNELYDMWAAAIQDGYIGRLIEIVEAAGGAENIYNMKKEQLMSEIGVSKRLAGYIEKCQNEIDIVKLAEYMENNELHFVDYKSEKYPKRLNTIPGKPYGLFYRGSLPKEDKKSVAVIGSRECSEYGRLMAEYFGDRLARNNINIISGMAWGIDGLAQMAAVKAGGKSYAVLGCGPDVIYPAKNRFLYERLQEKGNGIISEYAPQTKAQSKLFPPRNRIISGLCDLIIVVEARAKSGTLITVDMANDQGKSVMVVPGRLTDPLSGGCLNLIKDGATIACSIESVLEELESAGETVGQTHSRKSLHSNCDRKESCSVKMNEREGKGNKEYKAIPGIERRVDLTDDEKRVYDRLSLDAAYADFLADELGITISNVLVILTKLEMKGLIKEVYKGCFVRNMDIFTDVG